MPLEYKYDEQRRLLWCTGSGVLTNDDFGHLDVSVLRPGSLEIFDFRGLTEIELTAEEIRSLARAEVEGPNRVVRMAIVTGDTVAFGLARMFELLAEEASYETSVFAELEPALAWLGVEPGS